MARYSFSRKAVYPAFLQNLLKPSPASFLRFERIVRVDYENQVCDVLFLDHPGGRTEIPITQAHWGRRAAMGIVPSVGEFVLVGFSRFFGRQITSAYIVGYLPNSFEFGKEGRLYKHNKDANVVRLKQRKFFPGTGFIQTPFGSELILDFNIYLRLPSGIGFTFREEDNALIEKLQQFYGVRSGIRLFEGKVTRNLATGPDTAAIKNTGWDSFIVTVDDKSFEEGKTEDAWVEKRMLLFEKDQGTTHLMEELGETNQDWEKLQAAGGPNAPEL